MSQNFNNNNNANEETVKAVENTKVWSFNDFQVEFDVTDVDTADRYEKTFDIMGEKEKKLPLNGKKTVRKFLKFILLKSLLSFLKNLSKYSQMRAML